MSKSDHLATILNLINEKGSASVSYLSKYLKVSESTVRRYLNELSNMGLIIRVHGGAMALKENKVSYEPMFEVKASLMLSEKKKIAEKAVEMIDEGDTIILDSGTTTYQIAKEINRKIKRRITVISVDVKVTEELGSNPNIETIIIGGKVRPGYFSIFGEYAVFMLKEFQAEKVFLSADAVHPDKGITNSSVEEVFIKKQLIDCGKKVILVADHTKFGKIALAKVCDIDAIDMIITGKDLDEFFIEMLNNKGKELILV